MKNPLLILSLVLLVFTGCKKSGNSPSSPKPPGKGGNTGSDVTITSVSSGRSVIYADDIITITGTGFNTDKTKDTVQFGYTYQNKFYMYGSSGGDNPGAATILSATATQLVIQAADPFSLDHFNIYDVKANTTQAISVFANSKSGYTALTLSPYLEILGATDPDKVIQPMYWGYPGDSLLVTCRGPVDKGSTLTIGGKSIAFTATTRPNAVDESTSTIHIFLPPAFFGGSNNDTATVNKEFKLTFPNGKTYSTTYTFWESPHMTVQSVTSSQSSYSLSSLKGSGGVVVMHVTGHCLKSDSQVEIFQQGNVAATEVVTSLGVSGFPNETDIDVGGGSLDLGQWTVLIKRTEPDGSTVYYKGGSFYITK